MRGARRLRIPQRRPGAQGDPVQCSGGMLAGGSQIGESLAQVDLGRLVGDEVATAHPRSDLVGRELDRKVGRDAVEQVLIRRGADARGGPLGRLDLLPGLSILWYVPP